MAHDNIEVEIKVALTKVKFDSIKKQIKKISKFVKSSHHIDHYYNSKHLDFLKPKYPYRWLTIRERDGRIILNYKHWYPEGVKYTTHCDEYETEIGNIKQLDKILEALDIEKFVVIDKKRETYVFKNKIEIALDQVKRLGYFIEAESLKNLGGVEKTHKELVKFMNSLGITNTKTVPGGYGAAMLRKKGLMKAN